MTRGACRTAIVNESYCYAVVPFSVVLTTWMEVYIMYCQKRMTHFKHIITLSFFVMVFSYVGFSVRLFDSLSLFWPANVLLFFFVVKMRLKQKSHTLCLLHTILLLSVGYSSMLAVSLFFGGDLPVMEKMSLCFVNIVFVVFSYLSFLFIFNLLNGRYGLKSYSKYYVYLFFFSVFSGALVSGVTYALFVELRTGEGSSVDIFYWFSEQLGTGVIFVFALFRSREIARKIAGVKISSLLVKEKPIVLLSFLLLVIASFFFVDVNFIILLVIPLAIFSLRFSFNVMVALCTILGVALNYGYIYQAASFMDFSSDDDVESLLSTARLNIAMLIMAKLIVSQFITKNKRLLKLIELNSRRDSLTNMLNRRTFLKGVTKIVQVGRYRNNSMMTIMFLDLDHFKSINDTYGHQAGDDVLKSFSSMLKEEVRDSDFLCRWGGEEFIIASSNLSNQDAYNLAERLRQKTEAIVVKLYNGRSISVTTSIGVGVFDINTSNSVYGMIEKVDEALYKAKSQGRNRVSMLSAV